MDIISNLHDDLLLQILSFVPTITVFNAQLVSKRWRNLWRRLQSLHYDYTYHRCESKFLFFIDKTTDLLESPVLQRLYLRVAPTDIVISKALLTKRQVRELHLISTNHDQTKLMRLTKVIYEFETLVILRLEGFCLEDHYGNEISLRCLTVLELRRTRYSSDESLSKLLSSLPSLKDFCLEQCLTVQRTRTLSIVVPSLKRLRVLRSPDYCRSQLMVLNVNSSSLEYLNVEDHWRKVSFSDQKLEELKEADINVTNTNTRKLLEALISVKRLSLCLITSKIPYNDAAFFDQLVHLEICTCQQEWWHVLERVLFDSPKLRVLKLHQKHCLGITDPTIRWEEPSSVPLCFASHLETFEWRDYEGTEAEKELASYILRNAVELKTATIYPVISHQDERMHQILKDIMRQELENLSGCKLVFI